jgi:catechol 2,3-dioxygenase-like lactoylglutathione lyase family enzyme
VAEVPGARWAIAPYFQVADVVASANFYRDRLGFRYERFWGEPPEFCMVHRAGVVLMLNAHAGASGVRPNRAAEPGSDAWDAYVWVDDADALHAELVTRGARIVRGLCDQSYGCRDFEVEDLDGYRLCFGHDLEGHG